jgi:hypothetical protein
MSKEINPMYKKNADAQARLGELERFSNAVFQSIVKGIYRVLDEAGGEEKKYLMDFGQALIVEAGQKILAFHDREATQILDTLSASASNDEDTVQLIEIRPDSWPHSYFIQGGNHETKKNGAA